MLEAKWKTKLHIDFSFNTPSFLRNLFKKKSKRGEPQQGLFPPEVAYKFRLNKYDHHSSDREILRLQKKEMKLQQQKKDD